MVDPRPYAAGSLKAVLAKWAHLEWAGKGLTLPAMGYYDQQLADLKASVEAVPCDTVLVATPMDLSRLIKYSGTAKVATCTYELVDGDQPFLREYINAWIKTIKH